MRSIGRPTRATATEPVPPPRPPLPFDRDALMARVESDTELLTTLVSVFKADRPKLMADIEAAMLADDSVALSDTAHTMKGALSVFGVEPARTIAEKLEMAGKQGTLESTRDLYAELELARSNCYYAAWALSTDAAELPLAAATARVSATQAFQQCSKDNIQVHGRMGFTWAFDCHLYYRRSNFLTVELGGLSVWEDRLVNGLRATQRSTAAA